MLKHTSLICFPVCVSNTVREREGPHSRVYYPQMTSAQFAELAQLCPDHNEVGSHLLSMAKSLSTTQQQTTHSETLRMLHDHLHGLIATISRKNKRFFGYFSACVNALHLRVIVPCIAESAHLIEGLHAFAHTCAIALRVFSFLKVKTFPLHVPCSAMSAT